MLKRFNSFNNLVSCFTWLEKLLYVGVSESKSDRMKILQAQARKLNLAPNKDAFRFFLWVHSLWIFVWLVRARGVTRLDGARGKKKVKRPHIRTWSLLEANVLLKKVLAALLGLSGATCGDSAPGALSPSCSPFVAPLGASDNSWSEQTHLFCQGWNRFRENFCKDSALVFGQVLAMNYDMR